MKRFLLFAATLLLFVGCSESSTEEEPTGTKFTVSPKSLKAEAKGDALSVMIATNADWLVTSLPSWCSVSPMSGSGDATLTVTVAANPTPEKRSGTIQLTTSDQSAEVTVSQAAGEALPTLDDVCTAMEDITFMAFCYNNYDVNKDGKVSMEEANAVRSMNFDQYLTESELKTLKSIKGIEYFTNLEELDCSDSYLLVADLSANIKLKSLCFARCDALTSATIPNSVTTIGNSAFYSCDALTSITIPNSVTTIGKEAFYSCDALTSVTIPNSVTTIGISAFSSCEALTAITIPNSVTTIEYYAFSSCEALTSVTIPNSVTTIGKGAFCYCNALKEFNGKFASSDERCLIVDGVLNSFAPAGLTSYTIPNSVTTIGAEAFSCCDALTSVTIPNSVTTIGYSAFEYCNALTSVYCKATTPPTLSFNVFDGNATSRKIYVPASDDDSVINAYKADVYWRKYAESIEEYEFK